MKKKLSLLLVLCLALSAFAFTACGKDEDKKTPEEMLLEGRYVYGYTAPGNSADNTTGFFRFYEEKEVVGKVFYAYLAGKGFSGTYKLEKKDYAYSVYTNRDDAVADDGKSDSRQVKGTAAYTITYTDFDGVVMDEAGFDGEYLYHDVATDSKLYMTGMAPVRYTHDTDENSTYKTIYGKESLIAASVISLIADDDKTSTMEIYHNDTYVDLIGNKIEGTWTVTKGTDNTMTYTLTPKLASKTGGVLVVSADRKTAIFTPTGGAAVAMTRDIYYVTVVAELSATVQVEFVNNGQTIPANTTYTLTLLDDGTCKLISSAFGQKSTVDTGTWEKKVGKIEITFDTLGLMTAPITDGEDDAKVVSLELGKSGDSFAGGTLKADLTITGDASGFAAIAQFEFTGKATECGVGGQPNCTLVLYDDGSAVLSAAFTATTILEMDKGTWTAYTAENSPFPGMAGMPKSVTFDTAGETSVTFGATFTLAYDFVTAQYQKLVVTVSYTPSY